MKVTLVATYLAAIVAANLSVNHWGPSAAIYNAAFLIGLDLVCRDRLHDAWRGHLARNMAVLIVAGSALSYVVNRDTARIALASMLAFGAASVADAIVYHVRRHQRWADRSNESNVAGAAVDSLVFPLVAFGTPIMWGFTFSLFCAKVAGGYVWSILLRSRANEWEQRNRELYGNLG